MGEAKRRRAAIERGAEASMQELHAEAAGVLRVQMIVPADMPGLLLAALAGDARASDYLRLLDRFWRRAGERLDAADAVLCTTCDRVLTEATCGLVSAVTAERDDPTTALVLGVCTTCCAAHGDDPAAAGEAVVAVLRRGVWPELRPIALAADQAGRA